LFDFGLKTFLTCSEGFQVESPLFLKQAINAIKKANKQHSRKVKGSFKREQSRLNLARKHEDVVNQRTDWFWKLAHTLTNEFDVLCFETLNLKGMQRLWGRKVSDLAFGNFLQILEWVARKKGKEVVYIDRWYPSSKTCSNCGHILDELDLSVRRWRCPSCQSENDRDENASINIKLVGATTARVRGCQTSSACNPCLSPESHEFNSWEWVNNTRLPPDLKQEVYPMLKLYHSPTSPNSRRVWIALLEKELPFELVSLNLNGDQFQPEFLELNPFHHVPVLVDDGKSVVESLAILDYLEAKYPTPALMPTDAKERGLNKIHNFRL